jgi:hypothetical protein
VHQSNPQPKDYQNQHKQQQQQQEGLQGPGEELPQQHQEGPGRQQQQQQQKVLQVPQTQPPPPPQQQQAHVLSRWRQELERALLERDSAILAHEAGQRGRAQAHAQQQAEIQALKKELHLVDLQKQVRRI